MSDNEPDDRPIISRDGIPPLRVGDIVAVRYGYVTSEFVVQPQTDGTGVAVRFLNGTRQGRAAILRPDHFRDPWAAIGRYTIPEKTAERTWRMWKAPGPPLSRTAASRSKRSSVRKSVSKICLARP